MIKNYYVIKNAEGELKSCGYGEPSNMAASDSIEWFEGKEGMASDPAAIKFDQQTKARIELHNISKKDRTAAFKTKEREARTFLKSTNHSAIDPDFYPALYDEHEKTSDLTGWTPLILAQKIMERAEDTVTEGDLRRRKLIAEAALSDA